MINFEDVMFDSDPLELAESFTTLESPVDILITSDEEPEQGDEIYFGVPAEIGEIIELKGVVKSVEELEDDLFSIVVSVQEADSEFVNLALQTLTAVVQASDGMDPVWALGLKQQDNTYAVLANSPGGIMNAQQIGKIAELAEKGTGRVKFTHAQRVILLMKADQIEMTKEELASVGLKVGILHKGIRNIRACSGSLCRFSQQTDGLSLAGDIEKRLFGRYASFNIKIAISDCMRNCSESYCADIGFLGEKGKYTVVVGGRGSMIPYRALVLYRGLEPDDITDAAEEIVDWYAAKANEGERLNKLLERLGGEPDLDLTALEVAQESLGDGVDEVGRMRDHFKRLAGLNIMRQDISFCRD